MTARLRRHQLPPAGAVALALLAITAYAACASGAITTAPAARTEVALAAVALAAIATLLFSPGLRASTTAAGWAGLALLLGFTVWTGVSLAWSIEPDGTWTQLNRAIAYLLAAAVALIVGATLPAATKRVGVGFLAIATAVALYALGGKGIPWFHIPGVIDLNTTAFFSRLRAPLAYWNALALFCSMAVPLAVHATAERWRARWQQPLAAGALVCLMTTVGLTYSRGGVASVAIALLFALGPERVQLAAATLAGLAGCAAPLAVGFALRGLTSDQVALHIRSRDGAFFTVALLAGIALAVVLARLLEQRALGFTPPRLPSLSVGRRRLAVAAAAVVLIAGFAVAETGLGGSISQGFESFKSVKFERQNDPARILQTNSGNRWVWWNEAVGAWSDRPLEGWGAGSFPLLHRRYRHNGLEVLQPHSVPLEWLAELGIVGALLGLGALLALAWAGARRVLHSQRFATTGIAAGPDQRYSAALAAGIAAWLVHMWFDWDWDIPGVAIPLMVFLGLLAARPRGLPGRTLAASASSGAAARAAALALGAVLACCIAVSAALPSLAAGRLQDAQSALADNDYAAALHDADVARRLDPLGVDAPLLKARVAGRIAQFPIAAQALDQAVRRQPDNPDVWYGVARFDLARQDIPALLQSVHNMLRLDPVGSLGRFFYYAADLGVRSATATGTPLP